MTGKKGLTRYVWPTILLLSLVIIGFSVFFMFLTQTIYNVTLERTGSSLTWQSLDENSVAAISFIINRANWDEIRLVVPVSKANACSVCDENVEVEKTT